MPTTHPFSSPQMNSLVRWVLAAMLVMIGAGCQTEPEEPKGPQTYTAEFTITESHKIPTAVKWSTDNDSAEAPLVSSGTNEYRIGIPLASPPNTPVKVDLYRAGLLYYRLKFDYTGTTALTLNSGALAPNDVAIELLKRLGDKATDSSVAAEVARALLDNDTLVKSDLILSGKLPGLDTAKVVQEALKLLVAKNMPLKELVPSGKWILDIDTLSIHVRMRDLSLSGTIVADTNKLFPPYPVRVKQALAISGELLAGGGALAVSGVFEATNKLVTSSVKVFRDNDDATNGFEFPVNFDLIDRPSKLDLSGKLSIAAKPTTAPGTYRLEILLQDQDAFFAKATLEFQVVSQPTDTGAPVISREPGTNDSTVAYSVTSLTLAWKITGASRVTFNGSTVAAGDGIYTIPASSLKVGANGFKIVATNPAGKESSDTITIWRAYHDSIFPVAVRESGTKDTTVPHATESIVLSWRVTDNDTLQSVSIGGLVAAAVGDIYSATLPLKPGGNLFILAATDTARNATRDTVTVFRTLDVGAPVIERQAGTKDSSVSYATTGIQLSWKVTDDVGVSSVEINGSVVTGSDGIYSLEATNLAIGKNGFRIEAKDAGGKSSFDTLTIVRAWKDTIAPSIVRQTGTGPKAVAYKDSSFSPAWSITDNHKIDSVLFQGVRVAIGANGVFSATAALQAGANTIVLRVIDSTGNRATDSFVVVRSNSVRALAAGGLNSLALRDDGTVVPWGLNSDDPATLNKIVAIAAGWGHNLVLRDDGTVVAWGGNSFGQATVPATLNRVVAITAGEYHSLALRDDGTVVAWGDNSYGQATVPTTLNNGKVVAIAAGSTHSLALRDDGTVVAWGGNSFGQTTVPTGLDKVVSIAAGAYHSLALRDDGIVVAWGWNRDGQATIPTGLDKVVAIAAGSTHSLALRDDGTVVAWGWNIYGQATVPATLNNGKVVAIAAGAHHSLALRDDGTVVAWGYNGSGQTTVPLDLGGTGK